MTEEQSQKTAGGDDEQRRRKYYDCLGPGSKSIVTYEGMWHRQVGRIAATVAVTMGYI
jgi:hypothetical protein